MSFLSVRNLRKSFGAFQAIDDVSVNIARGEVCALVGPSGCGKTTTLRCIAGLDAPDSGTISLDGKSLFDSAGGTSVAPEARELGMVFQSYALWPHKSVGENVALGLRIKGVAKEEIRARVAAGLDLVGMGGMEARYPSSLSGGQQQRVALARALTLRPKCILFDEPLSNLDLLLRERMRFEIRDLLVRVGITAVYVTHDQSEAMVISDHMVLLDHGRIEQEGPPAEVYSRPRSRFAAEFLGRTNVLPLDVGASDPGGRRLVTEAGLAFVSDSAGDLTGDGRFSVAFRPELAKIEVAGAIGVNRYPARVTSSQFLGAHTQLALDLAGASVTAFVPGDRRELPGAEVTLSVDPHDVLVLRN